VSGVGLAGGPPGPYPTLFTPGHSGRTDLSDAESGHDSSKRVAPCGDRPILEVCLPGCTGRALPTGTDAGLPCRRNPTRCGRAGSRQRASADTHGSLQRQGEPPDRFLDGARQLAARLPSSRGADRKERTHHDPARFALRRSPGSECRRTARYRGAVDASGAAAEYAHYGQPSPDPPLYQCPDPPPARSHAGLADGRPFAYTTSAEVISG